MTGKKLKDAVYFPHLTDETDIPEMMLMISQLGLEGYGIYWILIEHLRKQPRLQSHLSILKPLAERFRTSEEKFNVVVNNYSLFTVKNNHFFFSQRLKNRLQPMLEKREKMRANALTRWNSGNKPHANALQLQSNCNPIAMQEKKRKEKERKENIYIYIGDLKIFNFREWFKNEFPLQIQNLRFEKDLNFDDCAENFLKENSGKNYQDRNHVLNAFKLFAGRRIREQEKQAEPQTPNRAIWQKLDPQEFIRYCKKMKTAGYQWNRLRQDFDVIKPEN